MPNVHWTCIPRTDTNINSNISVTANFAAVPAWDVNGDKTCDVSDLVAVGNCIGQYGSPGWIPEDVNRDGVVDVSDLVYIGNLVGQTW